MIIIDQIVMMRLKPEKGTIMRVSCSTMRVRMAGLVTSSFDTNTMINCVHSVSRRNRLVSLTR